MFYLSKARKLKHAAKIVNKLDTWDLTDIPTLLKTEEIMARYMKL